MKLRARVMGVVVSSLMVTALAVAQDGRPRARWVESTSVAMASA
jgi:post-segregation antitoxin (ccd killing protein)